MVGEEGKPSPDDISRFLEVMYTPGEERREDAVAFADRFARQWFYLEDGRRMSPKRIMERKPELWEAYLLWDAERKQVQPADARQEKRERQKSAKESQHPVQGDGEATPHTPTTACGEAMQTLDAAGRLSDDQAYRMASRDNGQGTVNRWRTAAKLTLAGLVLTGGYFGARTALTAKKTAEDVGGKVQQIQTDTGNFAENPQGPIPRTQEAREAERRRQQAEQKQPAQKKGR